MASYNAGPARIADLRREARRPASNPTAGSRTWSWWPSKEIGRETVDYVSNIYKYYLAYTLLAEHRAAQERAASAARQHPK